MSQDIDSEEESQELLQELVHKWVTIRIETYKQATKQTTAKS